VLEGARYEPTIIVAARGGRADKIAGRRLDRQPGLNGAAYGPVDFHSGRIVVLDGHSLRDRHSRRPYCQDPEG
jgi:hypothetical protein